MKPIYLLLMTATGINPCLLSKSNFAVTFVVGRDLKWARSWKTLKGIRRFIESEKRAGSDWNYSVLPSVEVAK